MCIVHHAHMVTSPGLSVCVFKSPSDLYPGRQCVGAKRALLTLGRGTCITASPRGARTPMGNAIPPGLTIITDVVHVLLRGAGHHTGLSLARHEWQMWAGLHIQGGSKGVMMLRPPEQFILSSVP